jgi:hypothetical protein
MFLRDKYGQAKMTETIAVLFIFFVLLMMGIVFYYKYQQVSFKEEEQKLLANRAMESTLTALFLPELQCTRGDAEAEDNCIDKLKLENFNDVVRSHLNDYYFSMFSFAKITVFEVYPREELVDEDGEIIVIEKLDEEFIKEKWTIYEKELIADDESKKPVRAPTYFIVALRDQIASSGESVYSYGYVKVEVYSWSLES